MISMFLRISAAIITIIFSMTSGQVYAMPILRHAAIEKSATLAINQTDAVKSLGMRTAIDSISECLSVDFPLYFFQKYGAVDTIMHDNRIVGIRYADMHEEIDLYGEVKQFIERHFSSCAMQLAFEDAEDMLCPVFGQDNYAVNYRLNLTFAVTNKEPMQCPISICLPIAGESEEHGGQISLRQEYIEVFRFVSEWMGNEECIFADGSGFLRQLEKLTRADTNMMRFNTRLFWDNQYRVVRNLKYLPFLFSAQLRKRFAFGQEASREVIFGDVSMNNLILVVNDLSRLHGLVNVIDQDLLDASQYNIADFRAILYDFTSVGMSPQRAIKRSLRELAFCAPVNSGSISSVIPLDDAHVVCTVAGDPLIQAWKQLSPEVCIQNNIALEDARQVISFLFDLDLGFVPPDALRAIEIRVLKHWSVENWETVRKIRIRLKAIMEDTDIGLMDAIDRYLEIYLQNGTNNDTPNIVETATSDICENVIVVDRSPLDSIEEKVLDVPIVTVDEYDLRITQEEPLNINVMHVVSRSVRARVKKSISNVQSSQLVSTYVENSQSAEDDIPIILRAAEPSREANWKTALRSLPFSNSVEIVEAIMMDSDDVVVFRDLIQKAEKVLPDQWRVIFTTVKEYVNEVHGTINEINEATELLRFAFSHHTWFEESAQLLDRTRLFGAYAERLLADEVLKPDFVFLYSADEFCKKMQKWEGAPTDIERTIYAMSLTGLGEEEIINEKPIWTPSREDAFARINERLIANINIDDVHRLVDMYGVVLDDANHEKLDLVNQIAFSLSA